MILYLNLFPSTGTLDYLQNGQFGSCWRFWWLVMGGDCLCKCETWNSEYFLQIPSRWSKTVILWLLSGQFSISWSWNIPDQQQENTDLFACSIILQIALLFLVHIVLVFLFGTNFTQLENNFLTNCSLQSPDSLSQPAAMSQTGKINLITCARLHLPAWASVMLGFDSF